MVKIRSAVAQFHVRWPMTHCASLIDRIWLVAPASLRRNFTAVGEFSLIVERVSSHATLLPQARTGLWVSGSSGAKLS